MLAILNSLNAHNLPKNYFQPILIILVSKFMVHKALPDKTYSSLGLLSPLMQKLHSLKYGRQWLCLSLSNQCNCLETASENRDYTKNEGFRITTQVTKSSVPNIIFMDS